MPLRFGRAVGVGLVRRGDRFGEGVGVGMAAASSACTGSARRTSGSAAAGAGMAGVVVSTGVTVGLAGGVVISGAGATGGGVSIGWARGAMIEETVAVAMGDPPGPCVGRGFSRCI